MYVVAATNIPAGRYEDLTEVSEPGALSTARQLSTEHRRVSFTVFAIRGDGAYPLASFLNGEQRFKALAS